MKFWHNLHERIDFQLAPLVLAWKYMRDAWKTAKKREGHWFLALKSLHDQLEFVTENEKAMEEWGKKKQAKWIQNRWKERKKTASSEVKYKI